MAHDPSEPIREEAEPTWFRGPSRRERWIAGGLFVGFTSRRTCERLSSV